MRKLLILATALGGLAAPAMAAQITIGNSSSGQATFTGLGNGNLSVSLGAIAGSALDSLGGSGSYTLSAFGPATATNSGTVGVWNFPAGTTDTFTYTSGANTLTETFTYSSINDGSQNPHFAGTDTVTAVGGSAAFVAAFGGLGRPSTFDFATLNVASLLDNLANSFGSESVGISSGEVVPNAVPEPASLALLGVGLLGLGYVARRRV